MIPKSGNRFSDKIMLKKGAMQRLAALAVLALLAVLTLGSCPDVALAQQSGASTGPEPLVQRRLRRVRPQIRVQPRYPYRNYHTLYPLPYDYEYPGPNAKRNCTVRYVQDPRPSGTVIVPRMRCWWVTG